MQVQILLIAIFVVTFFLNVVFRFFLVLYAQGFVKKGSLEVKLLKHIYWLQWFVLVIIGQIPFAIEPIVTGDFPRGNIGRYRAELCLGFVTSDNENINESLFLQPQFEMLIMAFYMVRFFHRVKKYISGKCPGGKISSIGKYQRNVIELNTTYIIALILHCFTFLIKFLRQLTQNLDQSNAFLVNFIFLDSFIYLLSCCIFLYVRRQDIPDRKDATNNVEFYVTKVQVLQPRRPDDFFSFSNQAKPVTSERSLNMKKERVESNSSKMIFIQQLKPKNCDGFWIRRKLEHPRVTIYNSKANQTKRKDAFSKGPRAFEMPPIVSDHLSSFDFASEKNPKEVIDHPSKIQCMGDQLDFKVVPGKKSLHRFSYFSKISH